MGRKAPACPLAYRMGQGREVMAWMDISRATSTVTPGVSGIMERLGPGRAGHLHSGLALTPTSCPTSFSFPPHTQPRCRPLWNGWLDTLVSRPRPALHIYVWTGKVLQEHGAARRCSCY